MMFFVFGFCVIWILLCGRMWWNIGPKHPAQRRLIAIGAGIGAAFFYYAGAKLSYLLELRSAAEAKPVPTSEDVRVLPKRP
jgi:hypothetical protein